MELASVKTQNGKINISRMTIETLINLVLCQIKEVIGPKKNIFQEITQKIAQNSPEQVESKSQEIKVEIKKNRILINLYLVIQYGVRIPDLTWKIQSQIKENIKAITGIDVNEINVHIQGIHFQDKDHLRKRLTASEIFVKIF